MEQMSGDGAGARTGLIPWSGKDNGVFYRGFQQRRSWQHVSASVLAGWVHWPCVEESNAYLMPSFCGLSCVAGGGASAPGKSSCLVYTLLCRLHGHAAMNLAPYGLVCGLVPSSLALKGVGGLGIPLGAAPQRDPGGEELGGGICSHGSWTGDTMSSTQAWAFQPPGGCSWCIPPSFLPDNTPKLQAVIFHHFYRLLLPAPASITKKQ